MFAGSVYPGAGAVAFRDGKVLMSLILRRGRLRWELPAGIAEADDSVSETMEATTIREVEEETFLRVHPVRVIATCWHYSNQLKAGWMGIFFEALTEDSEDKIPESKRIKNVNFAELLRLEQEETLEVFLKKQRGGRETILATGFVDWEKLDPSRIHPSHYQLMRRYTDGDKEKFPVLVVGDADHDYDHYSKDVAIYPDPGPGTGAV